MSNWALEAKCKGMDVEVFMPNEDGKHTTLQLATAQAICDECPVRQQCLDWAIEMNENIGIYGGLDRLGRMREIRNRRKRVKVSE